MSDTPLFPDLPEVLSPRLAWMKRHGVETFENAKEFVGMTVAETGDEVPAWVCRYTSDLRNHHFQGFGDNEDNAILDFCNKFRVPHWTVAADTNSVLSSEKNQGGSE